MTNRADISPGCSPALNRTTRSDTFGSSDTSASRASCPDMISGPPTGRRRMPSLSATCRCRGAVARRMSGCRAIRTWTRRPISSSSTPGLSARIRVRAYPSVCSSPGTSSDSYQASWEAASSRPM